MKFTNNSQGHTAEIATSGKVTINYIGGLAGYVESAVPIEINCNTDSTTSGGTIAGSNLEYVANATASVGGYFGFCEGDVTLTAPKWTGTVYYTMLNEPHTINEINCAGLIGHIKGKLTITSAEIGTGSSVWTKYESTTSGAANNTIKRCINMGGMVAKCEGEVSISNSINNATIEMGKGTASYAGATPNRQNDFPCYVGGFVGHITNAKATIENCENKARIYNHAYNNTAYSTSLKMNCTGGIIGAFGTTAGSNKTLTLKNCSNTAPIDSIRAFVAGIAGYVANATIDNCNYLNGRITDDQNCYMAGIVAGAMNSTITNCTATTNLAGFNGGSCSVRAGGIVAWSMGTTTIENCKYFGNINLSTYKSAVFVDGQQWGGLVGYADSEDTKVQNCQYGGQVLGVDISSNNCEKFAVAVNNDQTTNSNAQISNITYWNGK